MTKIILCGCNGKMGAAVQHFASQREDCSIVAGVDVAGQSQGGFPVYASLQDVQEEVRRKRKQILERKRCQKNKGKQVQKRQNMGT